MILHHVYHRPGKNRRIPCRHQNSVLRVILGFRHPERVRVRRQNFSCTAFRCNNRKPGLHCLQYYIRHTFNQRCQNENIRLRHIVLRVRDISGKENRLQDVKIVRKRGKVLLQRATARNNKAGIRHFLMNF